MLTWHLEGANPNDFVDPLTIPLVPPASQKDLLARDIARHSQHELAFMVHNACIVIVPLVGSQLWFFEWIAIKILTHFDALHMMNRSGLVVKL